MTFQEWLADEFPGGVDEERAEWMRLAWDAAVAEESLPLVEHAYAVFGDNGRPAYLREVGYLVDTKRGWEKYHGRSVVSDDDLFPVELRFKLAPRRNVKPPRAPRGLDPSQARCWRNGYSARLRDRPRKAPARTRHQNKAAWEAGWDAAARAHDGTTPLTPCIGVPVRDTRSGDA